MPPMILPGMNPIPQRWREIMQETMARLTEDMPGVGLCLFLFDDHAGTPYANYISNCDRSQALLVIREWVRRMEQPPA